MSGPATIVGDIETLLKDDKGPILVVAEAIVLKAIPAVLAALAGQETATQIAAPFVADLWNFGTKAFSDMAGGKGLDAVLVDLDTMCANAIEAIRFGLAPP